MEQKFQWTHMTKNIDSKESLNIYKTAEVGEILITNCYIMSGCQLKFETCKWENMAHTQEKNFIVWNSIEIVLEEVQTLDLLHKDFSSTVLDMYKELKETIAKEPKKREKCSHQINHTNKETYIIYVMKKSNRNSGVEGIIEMENSLECSVADLSRQKNMNLNLLRWFNLRTESKKNERKWTKTLVICGTQSIQQHSQSRSRRR